MRIALVTEEFLPSGAPAAGVTREIVTHLVDGGHDVTVFAAGRGQSTFRGARIFWASRMTSVGSVREAMTLAKPDVCHLIDPRRLGIKAAEAAERLGVPTLVLDPRTWSPGVDLADHHPGLRDDHLHDRWARVHSPDGGQLVVGHVGGPLEKKKVLNRLATIAQLPGVRLVVLGDGPGTKVLRAAGAKVIPQATTLERARCLATFDVLVQPRKREVYAPAIHEALASGVPVVAFDGGTAADVVVHEHNGLLIGTDRGGRAFARAVARLGASPDLRFTLAENARPSIAHRTWQDAVTELVDVHYAPAAGRRAAAIS
ncbi:glycosyltransferase [Marmoricola sp. URHB0036]|uniref:glycosyltransferase n=1 Tax=Marmoricola sp. URHB0036 TaxID=1298863 RepID=UPI00041F26CE|nr:glycosyltransferase [Marmoricola sp. URHB0036]